MTTTTTKTIVHTCGNCGRYTAVVNGWAHDFEADGYTPSERVHACRHGEQIGHPVDTVTANAPHTPDSVVVLTSGKVLEHGLYPNPDHHRGQPAGQLGTAKVAGYTRRAVLAADWKVWVRVDGAYGPTGDWFHARSATNFRADA